MFTRGGRVRRGVARPADPERHVRPCARVLTPGPTADIGSGSGRDTRWLTEHGGLYAAFDTDIVVSALSGASLLRDEELVSVSSGKKVHRIIARRDRQGAGR